LAHRRGRESVTTDRREACRIKAGERLEPVVYVIGYAVIPPDLEVQFVALTRRAPMDANQSIQ
jgi:hypothetical protein